MPRAAGRVVVVLETFFFVGRRTAVVVFLDKDGARIAGGFLLEIVALATALRLIELVFFFGTAFFFATFLVDAEFLPSAFLVGFFLLTVFLVAALFAPVFFLVLLLAADLLALALVVIAFFLLLFFFVAFLIGDFFLVARFAKVFGAAFFLPARPTARVFDVFPDADCFVTLFLAAAFFFGIAISSRSN